LKRLQVVKNLVHDFQGEKTLNNQLNKFLAQLKPSKNINKNGSLFWTKFKIFNRR
jgi:uncharacterized damage-inducible protein DinB